MQTMESELAKTSNLIAKVNEQKAYGEYEVRKGQFLKSSQKKANKFNREVKFKVHKTGKVQEVQHHWEHTGEMSRLLDAGTKMNLIRTKMDV